MIYAYFNQAEGGVLAMFVTALLITVEGVAVCTALTYVLDGFAALCLRPNVAIDALGSHKEVHGKHDHRNIAGSS